MRFDPTVLNLCGPTVILKVIQFTNYEVRCKLSQSPLLK